MRTLSAIVFAFLVACGSSSPAPEEPAPAPAEEPAPTEQLPVDEPGPTPTKPQMSVEDCEARGVVMGDPGDGSTHRPEYRCPNGSEPIGTVPSGIEGAVCCEN